MKRIIKNILAAIVYFLYEKGILHNRIKVHSIDETIDELLHTQKSLVRFGDSDIVTIKGVSLPIQQTSLEISQGLGEILAYPYDDLLVALPNVFDSLSDYHKSFRLFWRDHLLFFRKVYEKHCNLDKTYYSAFISRCYYPMKDKSRCAGWYAKIKELWKDRDIVVVEGSKTHNGVGNDLLDSAKSIERIICPPKNAYASLDKIIAACEQYGKDKLFLLSIGSTAKFVAQILFRKGYRVLDIGNMDMEYEWFLMGASGKEPIRKQEIIGIEANEKAGYTEYISQIKVWL